MPFDFKKEFKELYAPKTTPALINAPQMHFIAVRGKGNPNTSSEYQTSVELCYTLAYALKMSHKKGYETLAFSSMSCRLWRAFGGKVALKMAVMRAKRTFLSSA